MSVVEEDVKRATPTETVIPVAEAPVNGVGLEELEDLVTRCHSTLDSLHSLGMMPGTNKRLLKHYRAKRVADMVGFSRTKVNKAIADLKLVQETDPETDRPLGFTLTQVNQLRDHLGSRPARLDTEEPVKLAVQNFKGGVSKSVTTVYLAQSLAEKGYRVLVVDCDPQASATSSFGFVPDTHFKAANTLAPFIKGEKDTLDYAVIHTLSLIHI